MPTPKTVSADVAALMNAANKAAARTALHDNAEALAAVLGTNTGDEDTESILEKIGDGEETPRIKAEYMPTSALLEDENGNVPIDGALFANTAGVALAAGVVGWNNTLGCLVRHDGITIGGNPVISTDPLEFRGAHIEQNFTAAKIIRLFEAPLTALQAVGGARFRVSGRVFVTLAGLNHPPLFNLGMSTKSEVEDDISGVGRFPADFDGGAPVFVGFTYPTTGKDTWEISFVNEYQLSAAGSNFELAQYALREKAVVFAGTTLSGSSFDAADCITMISPQGLVGTANESLIFEIQAQANGASGGIMLIHYDLKFEQTA